MAKALYRQYRPKTFDQVKGQERVINVLKNQVKSGKISHAYLFSGERGTGKTTSAKIFAKAINCLNPVDGSPCLTCENCISIEDETTIDVVEMDAASNRRIDDIRNLKDNVIYPPNRLKYKVYIIDEAHMITREAFNALLKIMEEPPSHLVFILATTEIEKIPRTILSRVQKFEFTKLDENQIKSQIEEVLKDRNVSMETEAISVIIRKANGAMRDALSILDQVLSLGKDTYNLSDVSQTLGVVDFNDIDKLSTSIISKDPKNSLEIVNELRLNGKTNKDILDSLITYFNDIMIFSVTSNDTLFDNQERLAAIKDKTNLISDIDLVDYLDILIEYSNKLKFTDNTDVLTDLVILRLINLKNKENIESRISYLEQNTSNNVVDLVNKIVDQKLKNIKLPKEVESKSSSPVTIDNTPTTFNDEIKNHEYEVSQKIEDEPREEQNQAEVKKSNTSDDVVKTSNTLDNRQKSQIMAMLTRICGGVLNALFKDEGFNYKIINDDFIIYIGEDFYKIFVETKISDIEDELLNILDHKYNFYVESLPMMNNNVIENEEKEEEIPNTDYTDKLLDVFGNDLIIE